MPHRLNALVALFALLVPFAAAASAASLDKDEKEWLNEMRPIILKEEKSTFEKLEARADRDEFRKIFWARRDPNLETPENEFQVAFEVAVEEADKEYRVPGRRGAWTDCGRVFILLGKPDDSEVRVGGVSVLSRVPEVWIYRDRPGQTFKGGEAQIAFDAQCQANGLEPVMEELSASKIVQPQLEYKKGEDGRLVSLEDQLPKDTPAMALLKAPRQDFPLTASVSYLRISEGVTGVVGLVRGVAPDLQTSKKDGMKVVDVVVVTSATSADGEDAGWTEQPVSAAVQDDGSFLASFGVALPPGSYTLQAGAVIGEGPTGSLTSVAVEVPDFALVETADDGSTVKVPSVASIIFIRDIQEAKEADPTRPFAAFRLGGAQLIPFHSREFLATDVVSFFYLVYDLATAPGSEEGDASIAFSILKNGRTPVAQAPENPVKSAMVASSIGPVPLGSYAPGEYVVQLRVTDRISKKTVVQNEKFTIVAPGGAAE